VILHNKKKTAEVDFNVINLKIIDDLTYELYLDESYNKYNNSYLWNYVQRDLLAAIFKEHPVCVEILDKQHVEILKEYLDEFYTIFEISNEKAYIFSEKADLRLLTELIEGTDIWIYAGLLNIYACHSIRANAENLDYYFKVEPFGDNLGISITLSKESGAAFKENLIERIQSVTEDYRLKLNIKREGVIC